MLHRGSERGGLGAGRRMVLADLSFPVSTRNPVHPHLEVGSHLRFALQETRAKARMQPGTWHPSPIGYPQVHHHWASFDLKAQVRTQSARHQRPLLALLFHSKALHLQGRKPSCFL